MIRRNVLAVVVGNGTYNDLGLIRSCGEARMPVVYIGVKNEVVPIHRSRYIVEFEAVEMTEVSVVNALNRIVEKYKDMEMALFPASDSAAVFIDRNYIRLGGAFGFLPNAAGELDRLMNKACMVNIARQAGLWVPESKSYDLTSDKLDWHTFPCIVKPLRSIAGGKLGIRICKDMMALCEAVEFMKRSFITDVLVQQLIHGPNQQEIAVTGVVDMNGGIDFSGLIRKRRIIGNGSTVYGEYEPNAESGCEKAITAFLNLTAYRGIFDMEFLKNDNGTYFIECNFRNGAYGYAVTASGFNMPAKFAGIEPHTMKLRSRIFMEERSDIINVKNGRIGWMRWLGDFMTSDTLLSWNWKDPKPMLRIPYFIKKHFVKGQ